MVKGVQFSVKHLSSIHRMTYSTLKSLPKSQSFTEYLDSDPTIASKEEAFKISESPSSPEYANFFKRRIIPSGAYSFTKPLDRKEYKFLMASDAALESLGLPKEELDNPEFQKIVSGEDYKSNGFFPYSQAYAGWQFGAFAGQLGDGRVVNLFEVENYGERFELQLKGAGLTPFSRFADGKAVLRSSIREFIISESLILIGIPSSRALSITMLPQTRAMRSNMEQCAVVCRMAETWIRIGTFDLYRMRNDRGGIRKLSDYVIDQVFHNELGEFDNVPEKLGKLTRYDKMYLEIVRRNATTVGKWQAYGFLNGVLNTDNTSIIGLSIDFGPFAFMDRFDPDYTSNHDDHGLRYSFRETPNAIFWNLARLGEDLVELIGSGEKLIDDEYFIEKGVKLDEQEDVLNRCTEMVQYAHAIYQEQFLDDYYDLMSKRLGLTEHLTSDADDIHSSLLNTLQKLKLDYNNFFVILQNLKIDGVHDGFDELARAFIPDNHKETVLTNVSEDEIVEELTPWLQKFSQRLQEGKISDSQRYEIASKVNPLLVPRNWMLQEVIDYTEEHEGDIKYMKKFLQMSTNPYDQSKWGEFDKELETRWMQNVSDDKKLMSKCSCSS